MKNNHKAAEDFLPIYNRFVFKYENASRMISIKRKVKRVSQIAGRLRRASGCIHYNRG